MTPAVVFGGYGTFGAHVARELVRQRIPVVIAGRTLARAQALAMKLGPLATAAAADVTSFATCRGLLEDRPVAVSCAGAFSDRCTALLDACLDAGSHHVDIADDRAYAAAVRRRGVEFAERGLTAACGCSSLPAISGALGLIAARGGGAAPELARVTLFIGNDNARGPGAVRSALRSLGRPIAAPQGTIVGFRDREIVPLPPPFGPRPAYNLESPDLDLLPGLLGVRSVVVKVAFELRLVGAALAVLARTPPCHGRTGIAFLTRAARWLPRIGSSGGAIMTEIFYGDGSARRAALVAREHGQRMAALPCAWVAQSLCQGVVAPRGARLAHEVLGVDGLLERLAAEGYELHVEGAPFI